MKSNLQLSILLLMSIFVGMYNVYAQTKMPGKDSSRIVKSKNIHSRLSETIDQNDSIQKLKNSREFSYMNYLDSLLRTRSNFKTDSSDFGGNRESAIRTQKEESDFSSLNRFLNRTPVKVFFWILAFLFIGFISYQIFFKNKISGSNKEISETADTAASLLTNGSQYDVLIAEAESKNDYPLATRYWFLKTLKNLSDKEIIVYSVDKTNEQYISELKAKPDLKGFESLSRNYEFIWYGKFSIGENTYLQLKNEFDFFNKKI